MSESIEVKSTSGQRFAIANRNDLQQWRCLKKVLDGASETAEKDMVSAFGCHGEPIANAISEALWAVSELVKFEDEHRVKAHLLPKFQAICDAMTDVRSDLDVAMERAINEAKQEGWNEAECMLPGSCDSYASDHGVDLNTSLEDAFEAGVNAVSGYLDGTYPETVSFTMDDL